MLATDRPPQNALVIGGGEGATLREALKYRSLTRAVMVDIDGEVVDLCKKHLAEMHRGAFEDKRTEVRNEDRSEEHTSELQSRLHLVCRILLEKKKKEPEYGSDS